MGERCIWKRTIFLSSFISLSLSLSLSLPPSPFLSRWKKIHKVWKFDFLFKNTNHLIKNDILYIYQSKCDVYLKIADAKKLKEIQIKETQT